MVQRASSLSLQPIFQLLFYLFPGPGTADKQPSSLPPLSPGQSQCLGSSQPLPFHPSLLLSDTSWAQPSGCRTQCVLLDAGMLGKLHPSFEVRTPPTQEKSGYQVRQKCPHDLGSQEGSGRTRHSALWPDSYCKTHKDQQTSTDYLISMDPVFSGVRTALSMIPLFFNHL